MPRNIGVNLMANGQPLRAVVAVPGLSNAGNMEVVTAENGTDFVQLPGFDCFQVSIAAPKTVDIEVNQFGAGAAFPIYAGTTFTFRGIPNSNWLRLRRMDRATTPVSVIARWEG